MKIFLTGGTGFIGSHFINLAHAQGLVVVAHRRSQESRPRIPLQREPQWLELPLDEIESEHLAGCEAVVHLAAHTPNPPYDTFENCFYWNVMAAIRLFERAAQAGIKHWIVAGSCFEYGRSGERYSEIPTTAPLEPTASYPASKAAASSALAALAITNESRLFIGRIFQVFGLGELESRFWPSMRKAALSGEDFPMSPGEQVRDFVPVDQVARAFLRALSLPAPLVANIGTGRPQTLRAFAGYWWKKWEAKGKLLPGALPYRPNEVMRYVPEVNPLLFP